MFAEYSNSVLDLRQTGRVRQKGALSSFHIPYNVITDPIWRERYGERVINGFHCRSRREERLALGKHQERSGCRLIVKPALKYEEYGPRARLVRLQSLVKFLEDTTNELAEVAVNAQMPDQENVTIVGDWFAAEAVSAKTGHGYRQTIFTSHAPSMCSRIEQFDQEFYAPLAKNGWHAETCILLWTARRRRSWRRCCSSRRQCPGQCPTRCQSNATAAAWARCLQRPWLGWGAEASSKTGGSTCGIPPGFARFYQRSRTLTCERSTG